MPTAEFWTGIIGFFAVVAGAVINIYIGTNHKDDPSRNFLMLSGGLGILSLVFMIFFPPLGILLLIATLVLNTISSLNETNQDYYTWIDGATLLTMAGLVMASLSAYYRALKTLSNNASIPGTAIFIIMLGAILVFFGAIVNFYAGRRAGCANLPTPECVPDLTKRNYHYILGATLLGSLALMPALFMINRALAIIGFLLIAGTTTANIVLADHSLDDPDLHGWSNAAAWLSGVGLLLFTVAIWYIGSVKAKPIYTKTKGFLPTIQSAAEVPGPSIPLPIGSLLPEQSIIDFLKTKQGQIYLEKAKAQAEAAGQAV